MRGLHLPLVGECPLLPVILLESLPLRRPSTPAASAMALWARTIPTIGTYQQAMETLHREGHWDSRCGTKLVWRGG